MQTQITCPNCGVPYVADIHQVIDAARQPQLKEMLLSGQLNVAVCPNCGAGGRIATPLLYHDPDHDLFMVHVPQELNLDQVRREELIGRMVQQVVNQTPMEKRRGYMLQPQTMLTMQSFMERVWGTEGVTPEMLARQQKQVELLRTLAMAAPDVQDFLLKERAREIDETFFAILRAQIEATGEAGDPNQVNSLLNLQAKLMTETPVGRQIERQQIALHALNQDAKKANGLSPQLLFTHILRNEHDDGVVNLMAVSARNAVNYEFFALLTGEIEKREKNKDAAGAQRLTAIRDRLLEMQREMQQAAQNILQEAQQTLEAILAAPDMREAIADNMARIDDAFMHVVDARMAHAQQSGRTDEVEKLRRIQEEVINLVQGETPPEVQLLSQLVNAPDKAGRERLMSAAADLLSPELVQVVDMLRQQANEAGQPELAQRLGEIRGELNARLLTAGAGGAGLSV
ncbi:MAG: CpXC domain-containing protein [Candidatus Promineofilum sp.]|nr:CpXC domain-containing protein [Promineifilum sp.]MCW5862025.1 CpXC domain-containing protein [Anaerolineae bacterium]